jgi:hypothetical protein
MKPDRHLLPLAVLAVSLGLLTWLLMGAKALGAQTPQIAWSRDLEPVVLSADRFPAFAGAPLGELFAYAYSGGGWAQIPFQVDEVDAGGVYTVEDGLLDANDELVFMARDLGNEAAPWQWIADAEARSHLRYQVAVANPLNPAELGWVYVYRSSTLAPASADYVAWDAANDRVLAGTYVADFAPAVHPGLDALELNGSGVDALDRSKVRIEATCWVGPIPINATLTEEDLDEQFDATPDVDGPVRVGSGGAQGVSWFYPSLYQSQWTMSVGDLEPPPPCTRLDINAVRISVDWLDPSGSGMAPATYFDGNVPGGVPIDGSADSVPAAPATLWKQVSGGQGSAVQVVDVALDGGTLSNCYVDDATVDPDDTGDGQSFGDAGFRVDDPVGQVEIGLLTFILPPGQPNLGVIYQDYFENPLEVTVAAQGAQSAYLPLVFKYYP